MHNNHQFIKNKGEEIIFIHKSINNYKIDLYDKYDKLHDKEE